MPKIGKNSKKTAEQFFKNPKKKKMTLGDMTLEFGRISYEIPKNEVENRFSSIGLIFILNEFYRN